MGLKSYIYISNIGSILGNYIRLKKILARIGVNKPGIDDSDINNAKVARVLINRGLVVDI